MRADVNAYVLPETMVIKGSRIVDETGLVLLLGLLLSRLYGRRVYVSGVRKEVSRKYVSDDRD